MEKAENCESLMTDLESDCLMISEVVVLKWFRFRM